jgi:hypothetical protein
MTDEVPASMLKSRIYHDKLNILNQWYLTSFVRVPPDIISLQLCTSTICCIIQITNSL